MQRVWLGTRRTQRAQRSRADVRRHAAQAVRLVVRGLRPRAARLAIAVGAREPYRASCARRAADRRGFARVAACAHAALASGAGGARLARRRVGCRLRPVATPMTRLVHAIVGRWAWLAGLEIIARMKSLDAGAPGAELIEPAVRNARGIVDNDLFRAHQLAPRVDQRRRLPHDGLGEVCGVGVARRLDEEHDGIASLPAGPIHHFFEELRKIRCRESQPWLHIGARRRVKHRHASTRVRIAAQLHADRSARICGLRAKLPSDSLRADSLGR